MAPKKAKSDAAAGGDLSEIKNASKAEQLLTCFIAKDLQASTSYLNPICDLLTTLCDEKKAYTTVQAQLRPYFIKARELVTQHSANKPAEDGNDEDGDAAKPAAKKGRAKKADGDKVKTGRVTKATPKNKKKGADTLATPDASGDEKPTESVEEEEEIDEFIL